jgi:hypothetical protein
MDAGRDGWLDDGWIHHFACFWIYVLFSLSREAPLISMKVLCCREQYVMLSVAGELLSGILPPSPRRTRAFCSK